MSAFFGLDANYEQSNFNEISAEDLVLISGGTWSAAWEIAGGVAEALGGTLAIVETGGMAGALGAFAMADGVVRMHNAVDSFYA